eukprot:gnl/TRDRNA2_/TRDRNA2_134033_c0_seq1.p2 gnl/TRDRNA2_/TRDRNA2_134033_c0~~gnl/TRDRNA2_/TRDRNA2_134033_c0_seq1.p2  ORF type:complete len:127 (-),score=29.37 gnl/TRDRNA2_/TRDRNA2_134033_c0_seq1:732-1112(-)
MIGVPGGLFCRSASKDDRGLTARVDCRGEEDGSRAGHEGITVGGGSGSCRFIWSDDTGLATGARIDSRGEVVGSGMDDDGIGLGLDICGERDRGLATGDRIDCRGEEVSSGIGGECIGVGTADKVG